MKFTIKKKMGVKKSENSWHFLKYVKVYEREVFVQQFHSNNFKCVKNSWYFTLKVQIYIESLQAFQLLSAYGDLWKQLTEFNSNFYNRPYKLTSADVIL